MYMTSNASHTYVCEEKTLDCVRGAIVTERKKKMKVPTTEKEKCQERKK